MHSTEIKIQLSLEELFDGPGRKPEGPFAIAFSGGSDSMALLLALSRILGADLLVPLYVNHRLRAEDELAAEIALNQQHCRTLGMELVVLDVGQGAVQALAKKRQRGIEEAARHLRYQALEDACKKRGITYLFTAHNSDDQLETLLMHLGQGSSVRALGGVRPRRHFGSIVLLRPALRLSHRQLQEYVASQGFGWSEDATNVQSPYLRNTVRRGIKPSFLEIFPSGRKSAGQLAQRLQGVGDLLEDLVGQLMQNVCVGEDGSMFFPRAWFVALHPTLSELVMLHMVGQIDGREDRVAHTMVEDLVVSVRTGPDSFDRSVGQVVLSCQGDRCALVTKKPSWSMVMELVDPFSEQTIDLTDGFFIEINRYGEGQSWGRQLAIDAAALDHPVLRSWLSSDEILLETGRTRVSKLLSQMKIPPHMRSQIPVLVDRSGVVAVFGFAWGGRDRMASRFKAPLAHSLTNIYSSNRRMSYSEI